MKKPYPSIMQDFVKYLESKGVKINFVEHDKDGKPIKDNKDQCAG